MPDFSPYSPDKPFVPHQFTQLNLNDAIIPPVTVPEVGQVTNAVGAGEQDNPWAFFLKTTGRNPFSGLGIVPAGPAAMTDYASNKKFSSEAASYQSGNTYRDYGFLIGRDNEDLFAKHRSWWDESFNTVFRLLDKAGGYTVQGFGFLGGLVGVGNKHGNYSNNSGFSNWIAGAADNSLATWARDVNANVDDLYRPIYNEASDRNKGFFKRMFTDSEFWKGDAVNMGAFLVSAYATGNLGQILNVGGKAVEGAASLRGLNFANTAEALSEEGISGASEATNLSKGATITPDGAAVVPNAFSRNAGNLYSRVLKESGNFNNAAKLNLGVSSLLETSSFSMMNAADIKDEVSAKLASMKNPDGSPKYTADEIRSKSANAAKNTFGLTMLTMFPSTLWNMRVFFGKAALTSARNASTDLIRRESGLLSDAEIAKRTFGQKGVDYLKTAGTGVLVDGLWQNNVQVAIARLNQTDENIDDGFFTNVGKALNQYAKQTSQAISGNDPEASMAIGLGGLTGAIMGTKRRMDQIKSVKRDVAQYNAEINAFRTTARDLYEKNPDGTVKLNDDGNPIVNATNVLSYISSLNKTLNMSELAESLKAKHMDVLHSIVDNENVARLVKAYADAGMVDNLIDKLDNAKGYKPEDLMLLGLNPDKTNVDARMQEIKKKATDYKNIYDNIEKNFFVDIRKDDKYGTKARLMKDKLYFLSTRAKNLADLKQKVDSKVESDVATINVTHTGANDGLTEQLNDLYSTFAAAKRRVDYLSTANDASRIIEQPLLPGKNKKVKPVRTERFTTVDEQDLSDAVSAKNIAEQKMRDFLEDNKDVIKDIKKNADGTYRFESDEKNRLIYETDVNTNQNVSKDLDQARNATLNVFNRMSDIKYGERYYDNVYSRRKENLQDEVVNDENDNLDENLNDEVSTKGVDPIVPEDEVLIQSDQDLNDNVDELNKLKEEKDGLEQKEDSTLEDDARLDEINSKIDKIEKTLNGIDEAKVEYEVASAPNIPLDKKQDYTKILDTIEKDKRRVVKKDGYYEVDGERYSKVSDLIGNTVPEELRDTLQNALAAGYTVDSVVKAYFDRKLDDAFKAEIANKMSQEAYDKLIKQLDVVQKSLTDRGINIVATNVPVFDTALKVAGEIDILGVDKNGNFKVYEIEARQGKIWSQIATRTGRGPDIYTMSQKQLSAYRNLFANQHGHVPDSIAVMFPIDVKYDKTSPSGFIEKVNLKKELRYTPTSNVEIKSNIFQPVKIGSKYDGFDMTKFHINSFIPKTMEVVRDKFRFLLRNETFDNIKKNLQVRVKPAEAQFQDLFKKQQAVIEGQVVDGFKITPVPDTPNLYALRGDKEISIVHQGQMLGFMSPSPTFAYKGEDGKFHTLDENTDLDTYKKVTGNSEQTFTEFKNISRSYKKAYSEISSMLQDKPEATLINADVQRMFDIKMSYGELDLVNVGETRPVLKDLAINGVKVGSKSVITVLHVDANDSAKVLMERTGKTKGTLQKLYDVDNWAIRNSDKVLESLNNKRGERVTDYAAVVETPSGEYKLVSLRLMKGERVSDADDFVTDLGSKFTAATSKNVFKNESISMIPKNTEPGVEIKLKGEGIVSSIYPAEDIASLEKLGLDVTQSKEPIHTDNDRVVNDFVKELGEVDFKKINSMFAAFDLTPNELKTELMDDFQSGHWSSMEDYLENLKCDM